MKPSPPSSSLKSTIMTSTLDRFSPSGTWRTVHYTCFVRVKGFYERHSPPVDEIWSTTVLLLSSSRQTKLHWQKQQFHLTDNHKMQLMQTWQKQYKTHQNHLGLRFYFSNNHQLWFSWNKSLVHKVICEYILTLYILSFYNYNIFCFVRSCLFNLPNHL